MIVVTGGAGFIGSHLADELLANGYRVRVLDCLLPQVHGEDRARPSYLHPEVELHVGDVRDFDLGRRFDAIACLFSVIAYLPGAADIEVAIGRILDRIDGVGERRREATPRRGSSG